MQKPTCYTQAALCTDKKEQIRECLTNPPESEAEEETDILLCLEALAILLHSDANTTTERNKRERKREVSTYKGGKHAPITLKID